MFGLDKVFGGKGLLGSFFDKVGMPWMNNVISFATNALTGNWLAAARDVFSLVSQFGNSWMSSVDRHQPLGDFASRDCFGSDELPEPRLRELRARVRTDDSQDLRKFSGAVHLVQEMFSSSSIVSTNIRTAHINSPV